MNDKRRFGIPATTAIAGHLLHPLLVTLPIGFLIGAFLSDIAFYGSGDAFWAHAAPINLQEMSNQSLLLWAS